MNKPIEDFKVRFNKALSLQAIKPVELAEKTGLSRSTISHYMSGYTKPKSDKLYLLAKVLDVNEAWLMGLDVPMERNNYEDQTILRFDAELDDALKIMEIAGYSITETDDGIFIIKNNEGEILSCIRDNELVNKYESLQRKGGINAEALLTGTKEAFLSYLDSLGYHLFRDDPEHLPFMSSRNISPCKLEYNTINDLKLKIDCFTKATVDSVLLSLKEEEIKQERLERERLIRHLRGENIYKGSQFEKDWETAHLAPQAAHERTDIEVTDEMRQHDNDIMNDDSEWE